MIMDVIEITRTGLIALVARKDTYTVTWAIIGVILVMSSVYHLTSDYQMLSMPMRYINTPETGVNTEPTGKAETANG